MDKQKLISIANIVDAKGLHSIAEEIGAIAQNIGPETKQQNSLEDNIKYYTNPVEDLIKIADILDKQGHKDITDQLDRMIEVEALEQQSAIDVVLTIYKRKHKITSACQFCKKANIRKDNLDPEQRCPLGLPIPSACESVGTAVQEMEARDVEFKHNLRQYNKYRTGKPCPFAAQVLDGKEAVNCNFGTEVAGRAIPKMYRSSPIYPRLFEGFNTVNLDRSYYQYHDFSYYSLYG